MTYSTTDEISPTLSYEEYRSRLRTTIQTVATDMATASEETGFDPETELEVEITEFLSAVDDLYLTHPVSVIEHSEAVLSDSGISRLKDVYTTEHFAQEHARDLYKQDIVSALRRVLDGETVAGVQKADDDGSGGPFVTIGSSDGSEDSREQVRVSVETAKVARDELHNHIDYAGSEIDTTAAENAIADLQRSLQRDPPRTVVKKQRNMEEIIVPGTPKETLTIDYGPVQPRAVIHTDDDTVLESVVRLPSKDDSDDSSSDSSEAASTNRGGN